MTAILLAALLGLVIGILLGIPVTVLMYIAGVRNGIRYAAEDAAKLAGVLQGEPESHFADWIRRDVATAVQQRRSIRDELRADAIYQAQLEAQRSNGNGTH